MKKYEILEIKDFTAFVKKIYVYIDHNHSQGLKFKKLNITVKSWRAEKTSKQHRFYWVVITDMVKAFASVGYEFTKEEVHEFVKKQHGYTKTKTLKNGTIVNVTKSIADESEDVNIKVMMDLIDFSIRWCAINLDYKIEDPRN